MARRRSGLGGWIGILVLVVGYDYWAIKYGHETLSSACHRAVKHPITRGPTFLVVAILVKHLLAPTYLRNLDPLYYIAEQWTEKRANG